VDNEVRFVGNSNCGTPQVSSGPLGGAKVIHNLKHSLWWAEMKTTFFISIFLSIPLLFLSCKKGPTSLLQPQNQLPGSIDSLSVTIAADTLNQQLYTAVPCASAGWDINLMLVLQNRNPGSALDSITFPYINVQPADTVAFWINLSTSWKGSISAGETDTVILQGSVARSCRDPYYVDKKAFVQLIWYYASNSQMRVIRDSVTVSYDINPA
jgi:hypothetical protein